MNGECLSLILYMHMCYIVVWYSSSVNVCYMCMRQNMASSGEQLSQHILRIQYLYIESKLIWIVILNMVCIYWIKLVKLYTSIIYMKEDLSYMYIKYVGSRHVQQRQWSILKMKSVLSWADNVYHWQWRTMGGPSHRWLLAWLVIHGNTPKSKVEAEPYGCLSLLSVKATCNVWSILVRSYPKTLQQGFELFT